MTIASVPARAVGRERSPIGRFVVTEELRTASGQTMISHGDQAWNASRTQVRTPFPKELAALFNYLPCQRKLCAGPNPERY